MEGANQSSTHSQGPYEVIVKTGEVKAEDLADFTKKDNLAKSILLLALDNKHVKLVLQCQYSSQMWARLLEIHEQTSGANQVVLQKQFFDMKMRSEEKVHEYVSRAEGIAGQLKECGIKIPSSTVVAKVVSGLPSTYSSFMSSWIATGSDNQTLAHLLPRLMAEEQLRTTEDEGEALAARGFKGFKSRQKKGRKQKNRDKSKDKCFNCDGIGHWGSECRKPKRDVTGHKKYEGSADLAEADATVADASVFLTESTGSNWIMDSGASEHMTHDAQNFVNYRKLEYPKTVRYGNSTQGKGVGTGEIRVVSRLEDGSERQLTLKNVLHVPDVRIKLFSVGTAADLGNQGNFVKNKFTISDSRRKPMIDAKRVGRLYEAYLEEVGSEANASSSATSLNLWHERLGHINKTYIKHMYKNKSLEGMGEININQDASDGSRIDCISCSLGKQHRRPIPNSTKERADQVGARVHVDICGPIGEPALSGARYIVLFKDEYSNYRVAYFIKTKDEAHECIKRCIARIEADSKHKVKCLVSDCGSEIISKRTQEFLSEKGVAHDKSVPFTPQQNGFIERDNRTIVESTRTMLMHKKLPEKLWAEAANTAVYLLNRTSNRNTGMQTPFERFFGKKPRASHLRVFGSLAMVKVQEKKRSGYQKKLEARSLQGILVGYDRDFTYRIYDPSSNKIILTREVDFDEQRNIESFGDKSDYSNLELMLSVPITTTEDHHDESVSVEEEISSIEGGEFDQSIYNDAEEPLRSSRPTEDSDENVSEDEPPPVPERSSSRYNLRSRSQANCTETWASALLATDEPATYDEAVHASDKKQWQNAMDEEYNSLIKNQTWRLEKLPQGRIPIKCRWVFKIKRHSDGSIERYKARLVAKGYSQRPGIDYKETFSPVVRLDSVRILMALTAQLDLEMVHFDVKTAFLHGSLEEEIYMDQPEGYDKEDGLVCRLTKSLYGLKQAPKAWNSCFVDFLKKFDLEPLKKDSCILMRRSDQDDILIIAIYVDD